MRRNAECRAGELDYPTLPRQRKTYPEMLDMLGWCSWDAFYHKVDEAGLREGGGAAGSLGLPAGWVMIDDGWSETKDGKLVPSRPIPSNSRAG